MAKSIQKGSLDSHPSPVGHIIMPGAHQVHEIHVYNIYKQTFLNFTRLTNNGSINVNKES